MARCSFSEIVDLPPHNGTRAQCPECGAHRHLKLAFQEGEVGRVWQWHTVEMSVAIVHASEVS